MSNREKANMLRVKAAAAKEAARWTDDHIQYMREMEEARELEREADRLDPRQLQPIRRMGNMTKLQFLRDEAVGMIADLETNLRGMTADELDLVTARLTDLRIELTDLRLELEERRRENETA